MPHEFGRVENDQAEPIRLGNQAIEIKEQVGFLEGEVGQAVELGVGAGEFEGGLGGIDAEDRRRPAPGGVQAEAAGIAEGIEHAPARGEAGDRLAVVALIEIIAGLLPLGEIDAEDAARARRSRSAPAGAWPRNETS